MVFSFTKVLGVLAGFILVVIPVGILNEQVVGSEDGVLSLALRQVSSRYYLTSEGEYAARRYRPILMTMSRFNQVLRTIKDKSTVDEIIRIRENVNNHLQIAIVDSYDQRVISIAYGIIEVVEGGYRTSAYNDGFGTITVGFGNTFIYDKNTGEKRRVKSSDRLNKNEGRLLKERIIKEDYEFLNSFLSKHSLNINSLSRAALVSFIYNIGKDAFTRSEVARLLSNGKITKAVGMMKTSYTTSKGILAGGLVRRRSIESSLLSTSIKTTKRGLVFN